jgi:hypothetical protein
MRPSITSMIRSQRRASLRLWVTKRKLVPLSRWTWRISSKTLSADLLSRLPSAHRRARGRGSGQDDPLLLAAQHVGGEIVGKSFQADISAGDHGLHRAF